MLHQAVTVSCLAFTSARDLISDPKLMDLMETISHCIQSARFIHNDFGLSCQDRMLNNCSLLIFKFQYVGLELIESERDCVNTAMAL